MSDNSVKLKMRNKDNSIELEGSEKFVRNMVKIYSNLISNYKKENNHRDNRQFQIQLLKIQRKDQLYNGVFIVLSSLGLSALITYGITQFFFLLEGKTIRYGFVFFIVILFASIVFIAYIWRSGIEKHMAREINKLREIGNVKNNVTQEEENRLIEKIGWTQQSLLVWVGVGLASIVGIVEILPSLRNLENLLSLNTILYGLLVLFVLLSLDKIFDHQDLLVRYRGELRKKGWDFPKRPERFFSKVVDRSIVPLIRKTWFRSVFMLILIFIFIDLMFENIYDKEIIIFFYRELRLFRSRELIDIFFARAFSSPYKLPEP